MNLRPASFPLRPRHVLALSLGLLLGQAVTAMAQRGDNLSFGMGVAALFIGSASASFVLFVLGQQGPVQKAVLKRQAQGLVALIGVGLLVSMRAFELLA